MKRIDIFLPKEVETKENKATERGELMLYFCDRINTARIQDGLKPLTMARMGKVLEAIPTKDLYYLKSVCDKAQNFSKKFWWEVNPKNHVAEEGNSSPQFSKRN